MSIDKNQVYGSLTNAVENGYGMQLLSMTAEELADDLIACTGEFEEQRDELIPICQEWLTAQGVK